MVADDVAHLDTSLLDEPLELVAEDDVAVRDDAVHLPSARAPG